MSPPSFRMTEHEAWLDGRKFLHRDGVLYTIRNREDDADYDPDEPWRFEHWCGMKALPWHQAAFTKAVALKPPAAKLATVEATAGIEVSIAAMSDVPEFPTLYDESSHGKRKVWSIRVESRTVRMGSIDTVIGVIVTDHGYEGGKMVTGERLVEKGKNLGRSNATTPVAQAVLEARATWNKKRDAGYAEAKTGEVVSDSDSEAANMGIPLPMLAQDFNKRGHSITFPCFAQHKLDGVRCVAIRDHGHLYSRNGKMFPNLPHIRAALAALPTGTVLDGELYSDSLTFQEIVGLVKKQTLRGDDAERQSRIYLCVYDCIVEGKTNGERNALLQGMLGGMAGPIRLLPTRVCENRDAVAALHAESVAAGYEGLMLRNMAGKYRVGVRSTDLQKYKEFQDDEYRVVGFKEGEGLERGCVIWVCETGKGQTFAVRPRGTHEAREALFGRAKEFVGKLLTVRFQELTTDGIPRFPVGIVFRDYE